VTRPLLLILHGPNLDLLGEREPAVYGTATLEDYVQAAREAATRHGWDVEAFQTNHEGELVDAIHGARGRCAAILINPGAFTHYAWSLHDALAAFEGPVLEVHISNIHARDEYHRHSKISFVATGVIAGLGPFGYIAALHAIANMK
jgi:3-dehydroquinate dehydratase-2